MSLAVCVCVHEFRDVNKTFHVFNGCCCKMEIFTAAVVVYTYFNCQAWWGIILCKCTYTPLLSYIGGHRRVPHFFFERGSWCDPSNNVCLLFAAFSRKKETPFSFFVRQNFLPGWSVFGNNLQTAQSFVFQTEFHFAHEWVNHYHYDCYYILKGKKVGRSNGSTFHITYACT